ncbi:MAG: TlpA family protein disulfide reductase [Bryobacteraceae bacterium]|nr:TlpA family protein disulfide reductase [Bryobacteraceae bacterium]
MRLLASLFVSLIWVGFSLHGDESPGARAILLQETDRKPAPEFALIDSTGRRVKLSHYRGNVLLLNFWATWCGGCKVEIPWFQQFHAELGPRRFAVLGASLDEEGWGAVKPYLEQTQVTYRMVLAGKSVTDAYGVASLPATFLIDGNGRIAATYIGLVDKKDIEGNIRALLGGKRRAPAARP